MPTISLPSEWTFHLANSSSAKTARHMHARYEIIRKIIRSIYLLNVLKLNTQISMKSSMSNRCEKQTKQRSDEDTRTCALARCALSNWRNKSKRRIHVKSIESRFRTDWIYCIVIVSGLPADATVGRGLLLLSCVLVIFAYFLERLNSRPRRSTSIEVGEIIAN